MLFLVSLVLTNSLGCSDTATRIIHVSPYFTIYFPNSFTPNGDGRNDLFTPLGIWMKTFEMTIYDSWGNKVFHCLDLNTQWDGRMNGNGNFCEQGVYVYSATVTDFTDTEHTYAGRITLIK